MISPAIRQADDAEMRGLAIILRDRRKELGLSRSDVCAAIGLRKCSSNLMNWEDGRVQPLAIHVVAWARALGMELDLHDVGEKT